MLEKGIKEVEQVLAEKLGEIVCPKGTKQALDKPLTQAMLIPHEHIGTDEAGKGDCFGPLVIAGVFVEPGDVAKLQEMGVTDSKKISDAKIKRLAAKLRLYFNHRYNLVFINPEKYNELYTKIANLNKLLAWGHARVIENLLQKVNCEYAIIDKFGQEKFIEQALMKQGRQIKLIQIPRAEQDLAVAAASILARDVFLTKLEELSEKYGLTIPKGCNERVKDIGRQLVVKYGQEEMGKIAKLHFKTTQEIMG